MAESEEVEKFFRRNLPTLSKVIGGLIGAATAYATKEPISGVIVSPFISSSLDRAGSEILDRMLSPGQRNRVGSVIGIAVIKIVESQASGKELRKDKFFARIEESRSDADELTEAVILAAMNSTQEKKVPFLASLIASFAFNDFIDGGLANYLVRTSESISFRTFCALKLLKYGYNKNYEPEENLNKTVIISSVHSIMADLLDLCQKGFLEAFNDDGAEVFLTNIQGVDPRFLRFTETGRVLYSCLGLSDINEDDRIYQDTKELMDLVIRTRTGVMAAIDAGTF